VPFTGTNGRRIYDYIFVPVLGPDGEVVAIAGTTRDVTDRQQAEQAIRDQAQRLSEADRAKDEFIATLSHELRNPLAPLRNSLHLLRMAADGDARTGAIREIMERQVNHLVRLVDDLLEMSRISRGVLALRKERVEVAAVVRNAVETSDPLIQAAGHELTVCLPDESLWVEGDPVRLAQILANLLNNAATYTDDGGRIAVEAWRHGDDVRVSVRDNGAGIAPGTLARMFEMFSRGERSSRRGQAGLGIGLALARRLAEMHGGSIDAHSEGPGKGSEFTVRFPLAADQSARPVASRGFDSALPPRRILVVDDNRDAADSLSMLLAFLGADVHIARDGSEAIEAFRAYDPAVVLLDIGMPGMDGYEVARRIRTGFPERRAAIVALTGWGQDEDRLRAREAGFDHHLIKPAELGALQALLMSLAT
jgi:signal transduction histidine kinase